MESIVASVPQSLPESLDFNLGTSAEMVTQRVQTSFQPSGGSQYDPVGGTKTVRFHISDEGWLDPASVRLQFDIHNTDVDSYLETVNLVPSCIFDRLLIKCGGQVVEDITSYGRVAYMMQKLINPHMPSLIKKMEALGGMALFHTVSQAGCLLSS